MSLIKTADYVSSTNELNKYTLNILQLTIFWDTGISVIGQAHDSAYIVYLIKKNC